MKKKFTLEIASPCSENFDKMTVNSNGSFCDSCMKNVIDLSAKTNSEVAKFIAGNKDKNICARLKTTQLEEEFEHNEISKINTLKYAAVAASVLLTSNLVAQEKTPVATEVSCPKPNVLIMGAVVSNQVVEKEVSILVKGKLIETKTNKPFDGKIYPNLMLSINGFESVVKVNPKTGEFSVPMRVLKTDKTLEIVLKGDDYYLSKAIPFTFSSVKNKVLLQDISIAAEELSRIYIAGGLGINYSNKR
jgi:hypothetical protein